MNLRHTTAAFLAMLMLLGAVAAQADAPAGYYDTVDLTSLASLRQTVNDVIDGHTKIPYTASSTDTWDVLERADQDPYNASKILDVYQNRTFIKHTTGNDDYNREHTWPKSYGFPDDGSSNKPYTDCHHLFLCDISYNSARSNLIYDDCASGCSTYAADFYDGAGGVNLKGSTMWQTWDGRKGDVARALFYMDVRYDGQLGEPDLILTDDTALIAASATGDNMSVAYMGLVSTLYQWHLADPVDDKERDRNDQVHIYQGNRNPFIDHPEWATALFGGPTAVEPTPAVLAVEILSAYPNPFNPSTTVAFNLAAPGNARVDIFALDGRLVSTLYDGYREAGDFELRWNGNAGNGRPEASGAFICRILAGGTAASRTLLLLE